MKTTVLAAVDAKPCPWCGQQPSVWSISGPGRAIACDNEDCMTTDIVTGSTMTRALERWNKLVVEAETERGGSHENHAGSKG